MTKISQMTDAGQPFGTDLVPISRQGVARKMKISDLLINTATLDMIADLQAQIDAITGGGIGTFFKFTLEDGSGSYQLEDGSGYYLQEAA